MFAQVIHDMPSDPTTKRPACVACSKAKRKCSKQLPACNRCRLKNFRCAYPVTRVMLYNESDASLGTVRPRSANAGAAPIQIHTPEDSDETASSILPAIAGQVQSRAEKLSDPWFLKHAAWEVDRVSIYADEKITYPDSGLEYFIDRMRSWLDDWTSTSHCAFIHSRIYGTGLPGPLQHAYAVWLTYRSSKTSRNRRIALQMAREWSKSLVQEQSMYDGLGACAIDTSSHLSRTQALTVFQLIELFDGDVRSRAEAEKTSDTMVRWADALLDSAASDFIAHQHAESNDLLLNQSDITELRSDGTPESTWKAWILSESVRRTWIVARLAVAAFLIQKQGFAICPGSIGFTGRSGMWDAMSPHAWYGIAQGESTTKDPVFCTGLDGLLVDANPSDVDDFAQTLLSYGRGREVTEDWLNSRGQSRNLQN